MFDFSPLWVLRCVLKLPSQEEAYSHWLHLFGFSPLCVFKCFLKSPAREDATDKAADEVLLEDLGPDEEADVENGEKEEFEEEEMEGQEEGVEKIRFNKGHSKSKNPGKGFCLILRGDLRVGSRIITIVLKTPKPVPNG